MTKKHLSSLANVHGEFDSAAKLLKLTPDQINVLKESRFSVRMKFPVLLDNGTIKVFQAYHVIHSTMRGPAIGGVQIRPKIEMETVEALASWSSHRCALLNIPFGGSCGAIECDPSEFSIGEQERISRRYAADLKSLIGANNNILTADIGSNQQIMCWFMDTYSAHHGNFLPAVVSGKPYDLGGITSTTYPAAIGVDLSIRKGAEYLGLKLKNARVAIQGFGKVGMNVAKLLHKDGAKIVAISDVSGAYFNKDGINIDEAVWHQQSYGILDGLDGEMDVTKLSDPMEIFSLDVEILVPAAIELQITEENVDRVKAKLIAEAAHDPVSPLADKKLFERGALVIPDILCNSGGVTGSYLEWVQNRTGYYWDRQRVSEETARIVGTAFDSVVEIMKKEKVSMRIASAVLAVSRLNKAAELRGVYA